MFSHFDTVKYNLSDINQYETTSARLSTKHLTSYPFFKTVFLYDSKVVRRERLCRSYKSESGLKHDYRPEKSIAQRCTSFHNHEIDFSSTGSCPKYHPRSQNCQSFLRLSKRQVKRLQSFFLLAHLEHGFCRIKSRRKVIPKARPPQRLQFAKFSTSIITVVRTVMFFHARRKSSVRS